MENVLTKEQLNSFDKDVLIDLALKQSESIEALSRQVEQLTEMIKVASMSRFGQKTEAGIIDENQLSIFNEVESICDATAEEPLIEVVVKSYKRKERGKLNSDLSGFPVTEILHELTQQELNIAFPNGYKRLPDEIYKKLEYHPAWHEVLEHHIAVYKDSTGSKILKADHPIEMLDHSIATPSLAAAIMNGKYANAMPLYKIEAELARNDVSISRQTMANWMITLSERYLSLVYDRIKDEIINTPVIHADETPVMVTKDGREGMHKNYMWVYRTGTLCKAKSAIVYDYQKTRKQEHPKEFLTGFAGYLVCDGYQVYHSIEGEREDISVAGCWAHYPRSIVIQGKPPTSA